MTLPPGKLGDKGQRYEIRATGYPETDESIIGWSETRRTAEKMADAIFKAPGCVHTRIIDREARKNELSEGFKK